MIQHTATKRSGHTSPATRSSGPTGPFTVWTMTSDANEVRCIVNAMPLGLEVHYVLNGSMLSSHRFQQADEALSWVTRKQITLQKRGWEFA